METIDILRKASEKIYQNVKELAGTENAAGDFGIGAGGDVSGDGSAGVSGTANTGGGGGGADGAAPAPNTAAGGSGGSGVVIVKEPDKGYAASGVWNMEALYENVKAGTWV